MGNGTGGLADPTILVVDDDPVFSRVVGDVFEDAGFTTVVAISGDEALRLLATRKFDLVVLDRYMPGVDGIEVLHWIRQTSSTAMLPVIMLTADDAPGASAQGLDHGADDYIAKPFEVDDLLARARSHLRTTALWGAAVDQEIERRAAMARAAARASSSDVEEAAGELCRELLRLPEVGGADLVELHGDELWTLATVGQGALALLDPAAHAAPLGRRLRTRAEQGAFTEIGVAATTSLPVAVAPIRADHEVVGILAVSPPPEAHRSEIDRLLGVAVDFASLASGVIGRAVKGSKQRWAAIDRIRRILADHSYYTVFQPVVALDDGGTVGYEALTRFVDGDAEATFTGASAVGVGPDLELKTLCAVVHAARVLPESGWLSVNMTPDLISQRGDLVWDALSELGSRRIVVELSEQQAIRERLQLRTLLTHTQPAVQVAIDDAGSSLTALAHLAEVRARYLKIHPHWVRGIEHDHHRRALLAGLQHFATETDADVIAQGVDREAERETLLDLGIRLGQGDLLAKPRALT